MPAGRESPAGNRSPTRLFEISSIRRFAIGSLEADLKTLGVTSWGDATALRHRPELFVDGRPQTLARWPNEGFVKTGEILGKDTFKVWNTIAGVPGWEVSVR